VEVPRSARDFPCGLPLGLRLAHARIPAQVRILPGSLDQAFLGQATQVPLFATENPECGSIPRGV